MKVGEEGAGEEEGGKGRRRRISLHAVISVTVNSEQEKQGMDMTCQIRTPLTSFPGQRRGTRLGHPLLRAYIYQLI